MLPSSRSPHGYLFDSVPPRAAFSHSASLGSRNARPVVADSQAQYAAASS
jgi:hypothetical protein